MRPRGRNTRATDHASHERWLVSYADFVTLLFAFFVVLFASSHHDRQSVTSVSKAIKSGFKEMSHLPDMEQEKVITALKSPGDGVSAIPVTKLQPPAQTLPSSTAQTAAAAVDMAALKKQLQQALGSEIADHEVVLRETPEGFVISLRELGFFNSGEANLLPGAAEKIKRIASILMQHGLNLRVEGHSDDVPIHTALFRSNWELSTGRAMAVLLLLVDQSGFDPHRISVAGYGQYRPVASNESNEGRRMNRRVDIVVVGTLNPPIPAQARSGQ
ncbi:MAG TPA: OmpA family protein [Acidisarcina sp.]